ncbi:MAG: alpha/beta hydrolase [Steroidobacter sp.]
MDGRTFSNESVAGADLDPDIRRFIREISAAFADHANYDTLPYPRKRQVAEQVRAPWAAGGPVMAKRVDVTIPWRAGRLTLRIHNPSLRPRKPALIYLHGGGWTLFSIDTHDRVMREYAARADIVVIGVEYALSPETRFPGALEQVVSTVEWVKANGDQLDIDPERIALGGDSAGGNLTMAACLELRDRGEPNAVRAMVLNYAAFDMECSEASHRRYGGDGYMLGSDEMVEFWNNYVTDSVAADNPLVCPFHARLEGLPAAFLAIAECDILAEQNIAMAAKLRAAGVAVAAIVYKGASHSFLEAVSIAAVSDRALTDTSRWLRNALNHHPSPHERTI